MNSISPKIDRFDRFYFVVLVIYSAAAIPATKSMVSPPPGASIMALIIPWSLTLIFILKNKVSFLNENLVKILLIYGVWGVFQAIKLKHFYFGFFTFLGDILLAYVVVYVYGWRILYLFEKVVVGLSVIGLFFWILWLVAPNVFHSIMNITTISDFSTSFSTKRSNLLYTENGGIDSKAFLFYRNSGFSWEPGRYSVMVVTAMFFNLIRKNFSFKKNPKFWILFLALLSTQSTTGYGAFLFLIIIYVLNKRAETTILLTFFVLLPLSVGVLTLPFMGDKITELFGQTTESVVENADYRLETEQEQVTIVPQRFVAISFELMNVANDPIIGYGISEADSFVQTNIGSNISLPGGVFRAFSKFGILLGVLMYIGLWRTSNLFQEQFKYRGKGGFFLLFILFSIGYTLWFTPIFITFWLFPFFIRYR